MALHFSFELLLTCLVLTPDQLFGVAVYMRGAWTLHARRLQIGDDAFFALLRT